MENQIFVLHISTIFVYHKYELVRESEIDTYCSLGSLHLLVHSERHLEFSTGLRLCGMWRSVTGCLVSSV
jgi:hypothetical protein